MAKRGLPRRIQMRHDAHYVDTLEASSGEPIGRKLPIDQVDPNPDQPRQMMGDLSELMSSIAEKGIIEPLIVRTRNGRYQIIAGERRYQAAVQLGLSDVPVVIRDVDDREVLEIALIENLQRKDLTIFEEAEALETLASQAGYTHEEIAKNLGKSRSSITETMSLNSIPQNVRHLCKLGRIASKSVLLQVARQGETTKMVEFVETLVSGGGVTREKARQISAVPGRSGVTARAKPFIYRYSAANRSYKLQLRFRKSEVPESELIEALESILEGLRSSRVDSVD